MEHDRDIEVDHVFLRKALGWVSGAEEEAAIKSLLVDLAGYLRSHFASEEGPHGFFAEVLAGAPQLSSTIDELKRQHQSLLRDVSDLAGRLEERPATAPVAVRERAAAIVRDIQDHERREVGLLQSMARDESDGG